MEMASLADLSFGSEKNYFPGECRQDGLRLSLFRFLIVDILFLMCHECDILYNIKLFFKIFYHCLSHLYRSSFGKNLFYNFY